MKPEIVQLIIGIASVAVTLIGVLVANSQTSALTQYKIDELTKHVNKHNNLIERMYNVEKKLEVIESKLDK